LSKPGTAPAQGPSVPKDQREGTADPQANAPIVPDAQFNAALPPLSGDINAPLEPMSTMATTQPQTQTIPAPQTAAPLPTTPLPSAQTAQPLATGEAIGPVDPEDPQLAQPLTPLSSFDSTPLQTATDPKGERAPDIRYDMEVRGLADLNLDDEFKGLSSLREGKGKAANATQVSARAREDEQLAIRLMKSLGYYDATAVSTLQREQQGEGEAGRLKVVLTATPGRLYRLSSITVNAQATTPPSPSSTTNPTTR
jgi:translocation and assembly module TamA